MAPHGFPVRGPALAVANSPTSHTTSPGRPPMSHTYKVGVVFEGIGRGSFNLVSRALPEAVLSEVGGVTTVRVKIRVPGPAAAVSQLVERVTKRPPPSPCALTQTSSR